MRILSTEKEWKHPSHIEKNKITMAGTQAQYR